MTLTAIKVIAVIGAILVGILLALLTLAGIALAKIAIFENEYKKEFEEKWSK